jgi:hypothetical protein
MNLSRLSRGITLSCVFATFPLLANISGSFDIGGSSATVGETSITFNCVAGIVFAPQPCPAGTGNFHVTNAVGSSFTPYLSEGGYIQGLSEATTPLNTPFLLGNWLTFFTGPVVVPDIALDLQFNYLGIDSQADCLAAPAPGQTCTPIIPALVGSPNDPLGLSSFNLQNLAGGGSSASFSVAGMARQISTGQVSPFIGVFTAALDTPYQTALAQILAGEPFTHAYDASFQVSMVPEPGFGIPVLFGCLAVLISSYRRRKAA